MTPAQDTARNMHAHDLLHLLSALETPTPWAEGDNIPWHDPQFSERMLYEHLDQNHDRASRRFYIVDRHVAWLQDHLLESQGASVLDLGCGPGLYCHRLAQNGYHCVGIDYSPAAIAYARRQADTQQLDCRFLEEDIRTAAYPAGNSLVMLLFGELNVFRPEDATAILNKAHAALAPGGHLVVEAHTADVVQRSGAQDPSWYVARKGLFGAEPHLVLSQYFWDEAGQVTTIRHYVVDLASGAVQHYAQSIQAYSRESYRELLERSGFQNVEVLPGMTDDPHTADPDFLALIAEH